MATTENPVTNSLTTSSPPEALLKLCLLWSVLHRSPPPRACKSIMPEKYEPIDLSHVLRNDGQLHINLEAINKFKNREPELRDNSYRFHYRHSSRSLSVIGVLGGIVLILFIVALSTCIKHRRNLYLTDRYPQREHLARDMLVDHIRQLRTSHRTQLSRDRPPSYDDVVKDEVDEEVDETQPPSYLEATTPESTNPNLAQNGRQPSPPPFGRSESTSDDHGIEMTASSSSSSDEQINEQDTIRVDIRP